MIESEWWGWATGEQEGFIGTRFDTHPRFRTVSMTDAEVLFHAGNIKDIEKTTLTMRDYYCHDEY